MRDVIALPSSPQSERAVLGSVLLEPGVLGRIAWLEATEFYDLANQWIYTAMRECETPDWTNVCTRLAQRNLLDKVGGEGAILELLDAVATSLHVESYARTVAETATRRKLIKAAGDVARVAYDTALDLPTVVDRAQTVIGTAADTLPGQAQTRALGAVLADYTAAVEARANNPSLAAGVPTGFADIDARLGGGIKPGELCIVAGRPGMGKTSLMLSVVRNTSVTPAKAQRKRGVIYTLEMSDSEIANRFMADATGVSSQRLTTGKLTYDEWAKLTESAMRYSDAPVWTNDYPLSIGEIKADARRMRMQHDIDYVMIDFLGMVDAPADSDYERASRVALGCKDIAKELKIAVLLGCQLSRGVEQRTNKRPVSSDLRDSGRIEEAADTIMMLYRDEYYDPGSEAKNIAEIIFTKNRNGPTGTSELYFEAALTTFRNLAKEKIEL
jgi:replicative DNA helicase